MKAFTATAAEHFVKGFAAGTPTENQSLREHLQTTFKRGTVIVEGKPEFVDVRDCLLRESERNLLMAMNCYARALDTLRPASSYWTVVSLYYSTFFAARSVLGMFGCWMQRADMWLEADGMTPGALKLAYRRTRHPQGGQGSHRSFWNAYYDAVGSLQSWIGPELILAVTPVNSSATWLIETRNDVNYDCVKALELKLDFDSSFDPDDVPGSFPGRLGTMYKVSEAFVGLVKEMATRFVLSTDVCAGAANRVEWVNNEIIQEVDAQLIVFSATEHAKLAF